MRPKRARAASTAADQSARAARSSFATSVSAPSARASRAVASRLPGSGLVADFFTVEECSSRSAPVTVRAVTTTSRPRRASSSAHARLMPRLAPVTKATRRSAMPRFLAPPHARGQTRAAGGARSAEQSLGDVHQLQLDAVGVGKEDGVVAGDVLGVLARRVEDLATKARDVPCQRVHLRAALRPEGHLAGPRRILGEGLARVAGVRLLEPEAAGGAEKPDHAPGVPYARVAETRHERGVEGPRAREVVHGEEHVVHAPGRGNGRLGRRAAAAALCLARHRGAPYVRRRAQSSALRAPGGRAIARACRSSSTPTWTRSTPRSSSATAPSCAGGRSSSAVRRAAAW